MAEEPDHIIQQAFGHALRELRDAQHLTQQELSDLSSVDRAFISDLENAKKSVSLVIIFRLSETLKMAPYEIVKLAEQKLRILREQS